MLQGHWPGGFHERVDGGASSDARIFGDPLAVCVPLGAPAGALREGVCLQLRRYLRMGGGECGDAELWEALLDSASLAFVDSYGASFGELPRGGDGGTVAELAARCGLRSDGGGGGACLVGMDWEHSGEWTERFHGPYFEDYVEHPSVEELTGVPRRLSLRDCFVQFTAPERLDEANAWYCSRCKTHREARKTLGLWKLPKLFVLSLKRFEYRGAFQRDKLDTRVEFPIDGLDLSEFVMGADAEEEALFDLCGVVNHYGRMGYGHYTAMVRDWDHRGVGDGWTEYDDESVEAVPQDAVCSNAAYMLLYRPREGSAEGAEGAEGPARRVGA